MDIHYNAFISYRHHPEDIKVAEQIHKSLEHYKVPKALKKKKDTKLRLFRDKEELPITSNLTDDITRALRNSDFLIVICSVHTKESVWVQREIETFLQTHDHSRVLTVLVNGEPYDTIPEILCSEERIDPVTGEKSLLPIEPLSCDWRVGKRKAYREELPRLAAALLGCGYDELRQRERQYRTRRLVTIFSVALAAALALMSYVIYNSIQIQKANDQLAVANGQLEEANDQLTDANIEIQKNLEEAQINQSQFLASASTQELDGGDRMLAMALAMAGLPQQEGERPYVSQTENALSSAVGVYMADSELAAVGSINSDALIRQFEANDDRTLMFVYDQREVLSVWDLETFQKLTAVQTDFSSSSMLITPEDTVLLYDTEYTVHCYDKDLNLLWEQSGINEVAMSQERDVLIAELDNDTVAFFDVQTGEETLSSVQFSLSDFDGWLCFRQDSYDLTQPLIVEYSDYDTYYILSADPDTGALTTLAVVPEEYEIRQTGYDQNGNILVLYAQEDGWMNGQYNNMQTYSYVPIQLHCLSPEGESLWVTELSSYSYSTVHTLHPIAGTNNIFCQVDSTLAVLDSTTGEVIHTNQTGGNPVWVQPYEDHIIAILYDGSVGSMNYDDGEFNSFRYFKEDIAYAFGGKGYFIRQNLSDQILVYRNVLDENWSTFDGDYNPMVAHRAVWGDYVATYNYDSICVFDARQQKLLYDLAEEDRDIFQLLEFSQDGTQLWISNHGASLIRVDMQTGKEERFDLPEKAGEVSLYYSYTYRTCMVDDVIYILAKDLFSDEVYVVTYDTSSKQTTITPLGVVWESYSVDCAILTAKDGCAYIWHSGEGKVYELNTQSGNISVYLENLIIQPVIQFLDDGMTTMVAIDDQVTFIDANGQELFTATLELSKGVSAYRTGQEILLLTDAGDILTYNLTGEKLGKFTTHLYNSFFTDIGDDFEPEEIIWTPTADGDLFVSIFNAGNLISTADWGLRAWVPNCVAYIPDLNQFVTTSDKQKKIGIYPYYTLKDVQNKAQDAMKGYTLTPAQKEYYGIS